jgi:hypothetical protein
LLADLVGAGVPVAEWRVEGAGLEDLFLQITAPPVLSAPDLEMPTGTDGGVA